MDYVVVISCIAILTVGAAFVWWVVSASLRNARVERIRSDWFRQQMQSQAKHMASGRSGEPPPPAKHERRCVPTMMCPECVSPLDFCRCPPMAFGVKMGQAYCLACRKPLLDCLCLGRGPIPVGAFESYEDWLADGKRQAEINGIACDDGTEVAT